MKKIAVVLCGMEYSNQQELVQGMIQYQSEHGGSIHVFHCSGDHLQTGGYKRGAFKIFDLLNPQNYVIPPTNKHEDETTLHNHHNMLYPFRTAKYIYDGCTGGKTGYTVAANSTLVTYAERDGMSLVCVVMNAQAPAHFEDTVNLFNYCFDNFQIFSVSASSTACSPSLSILV